MDMAKVFAKYRSCERVPYSTNWYSNYSFGGLHDYSMARICNERRTVETCVAKPN
jgi:hypothetical protein